MRPPDSTRGRLAGDSADMASEARRSTAVPGKGGMGDGTASAPSDSGFLRGNEEEFVPPHCYFLKAGAQQRLTNSSGGLARFAAVRSEREMELLAQDVQCDTVGEHV